MFTQFDTVANNIKKEGKNQKYEERGRLHEIIYYLIEITPVKLW